MTNSKPFQPARLFLAIMILSAGFITSCKKSGLEPVKSLDATVPGTVDSVTYVWGDMSGTRGNDLDIIKYNSDGKIDAVNSAEGGLSIIYISFTYQGNKIILNTDAQDIYTLDNTGRVSLHDSKYVEPNGDTVNNEEQYHYDSDGYLSKVVLIGSFVYGRYTYGVLTYTVQGGNYTSYTLADTAGNNVTRTYAFSYNSTPVKSSFSFYSPIFGDNTYAAIEKYLNFGKQSVDQLTAVTYHITDLDKSIQSGTLNVSTSFDANGNIKQLSLTGPPITGAPSDNLSPLPRTVSFGYSK